MPGSVADLNNVWVPTFLTNSRPSLMHHPALYTALGKLGYKSYHMVEAFVPENRGTHLPCWHEAIRAKLLGTGKEYGREEFDKVLGNYSVRLYFLYKSHNYF